MFWNKTPEIVTDEGLIDDLLSRSVKEVLPSKEALKKALMSGRRLKMYIGTDATGPQLHLGHATNYMLLEKFRELGHDVIILFGDFTALIGDPSGHDSARKVLTEAEVNAHITTWKSQVSKIVSFDDPKNPARILKNSTWLSKLTFQDVIRLAGQFTVQHMLERDLFEKRIEDQKPLYVHEFLYPVMQGYDSVAMDVDLEVGGTDQTFNMLAGRILQQKLNNREKFVLSTTLLENPKTGQKLMSKSLGNFIALNDEPQAMFGKTMALPDEAVRQVFVDCTYVTLQDIEGIMNGHPKEAKLRLATELVTIYHSKEAAVSAKANFEKTFSSGGVPDDAPELIVRNEGLMDALVAAKIVASKTDYRRLVSDGAIRVVRTDEKLTEHSLPPYDEVMRIGKHRFVRIVK